MPEGQTAGRTGENRLGDTGCLGADRVEPGGAVVGVDVSAVMLAAARSSVESPGVHYVLADAGHVPVRPASFDRVYSRFGVMFFGDPVAAFEGLRRALSPDGRLVFVSWQGMHHNEWMALPARAAATALGRGIPVPPADGPGPFSLADQRRVHALLDTAGYRSISITERADPIALPVAAAPSFAEGAMSHGGIRAAVADADERTRSDVRDAIVRALRARAQDGVTRLSRGALIVSASNRPAAPPERVVRCAVWGD